MTAEALPRGPRYCTCGGVGQRFGVCNSVYASALVRWRALGGAKQHGRERTRGGRRGGARGHARRARARERAGGACARVRAHTRGRTHERARTRTHARAVPRRLASRGSRHALAVRAARAARCEARTRGGGRRGWRAAKARLARAPRGAQRPSVIPSVCFPASSLAGPARHLRVGAFPWGTHGESPVGDSPRMVPVVRSPEACGHTGTLTGTGARSKGAAPKYSLGRADGVWCGAVACGIWCGARPRGTRGFSAASVFLCALELVGIVEVPHGGSPMGNPQRGRAHEVPPWGILQGAFFHEEFPSGESLMKHPPWATCGCMAPV